MTGGEKLVVALGWCVDDFVGEVGGASPQALSECAALLRQPDTGLDELEIHKSKWGLEFVETELARRAGLLRLCPACRKNSPDPRMPYHHPESHELLFLCDGCSPDRDSDDAFYVRLDQNILEQDRKREIS